MREVCASFEVLLYVQSLRRVYMTSGEGFITSVRDWTGDFALAIHISMDIAGSPTRNMETSQRSARC